jgi:hypothetical protein
MVYFGVMIDFLHNPEKKTELEMYYQYIKQISKEDLDMEFQTRKNKFEFVNEKYMLQSGCLIGYLSVYLGAYFRNKKYGLQRIHYEK